MSQSTQVIDTIHIREYMTQHLGEVFQTMLSMTPTLAPEIAASPEAERVTGSVGFAGETINGAVYLHLSAEFALSAAAVMLCAEAQSLSESEVNDAVGELANMLTGGLKSWLCDAGAPCAVSTPAIIRGCSFAIEHTPDVQHFCLGFECGNHKLSAEVHFKVN